MNANTHLDEKQRNKYIIIIMTIDNNGFSYYPKSHPLYVSSYKNECDDINTVKSIIIISVCTL